jgi:hypothetical protein
MVENTIAQRGSTPLPTAPTGLAVGPGAKAGSPQSATPAKPKVSSGLGELENDIRKKLATGHSAGSNNADIYALLAAQNKLIKELFHYVRDDLEFRTKDGVSLQDAGDALMGKLFPPNKGLRQMTLALAEEMVDKNVLASAVNYVSSDLEFQKKNPNGDHAAHLINYVNKLESDVPRLLNFDLYYDPSRDRAALEMEGGRKLLEESIAEFFKPGKIDVDDFKRTMSSLTESDVQKAFRQTAAKYVDSHRSAFKTKQIDEINFVINGSAK